jgi:signal transduction histidine kinase
MARNAMGHLTSAQSSFPSPPSEVPLDVLAGRLRLAAAEQPLPFEVTARDLAGASVPDAVAEALVAAATQAMVNSVNHAGTESGIARSVSLSAAEGEVLVLVEDTGHGFDPDAIPVERLEVLVLVEDTGHGFDPDAIPVERLGVRTSIVQRMSSAGGSANIVSRPGVGTRVELHWAAALVDAGAAPLGQDAEWVR